MEPPIPKHSASSLCKIELRGKGTGCHLNFTETWAQISNVGAPGKHQAIARALKGLWGKGSQVIERLRKNGLSFQEAFPRALHTFTSSHLVEAILSNSVGEANAGKTVGECFMGLGSEEGAYTLHWQALLPGGAWMAQGHWEPSSPTDSTPLPYPYPPSPSFLYKRRTRTASVEGHVHKSYLCKSTFQS